MVSDFIEKQGGYLVLSSEEHEDAKKKVPGIPAAAQVKFEYGLQAREKVIGQESNTWLK